MNWTDWSSFWEMGGDAPYVWGSVAAVLIALAAECAALTLRERENRRRAGATEIPRR